MVIIGQAAVGQTAIPLWYGYVNSSSGIVTDPSDGMARLGIYANIGGAPSTEFYVFDTGSEPFVSASVDDPSNLLTGYGGSWWGTEGLNYDYIYSGTNIAQGSVSYSDGSTLDFYDAMAAVTVTGSNGAGVSSYTTSAPVEVNQGYARITSSGTNTWASWQTTSGTTPPDGNTFYATFGADLTNPAKGMYAVSTDYAANNPSMKNGFIVHVGDGSAPSLTLGLSSQTIQNYSAYGALVQMQPGSGSSGNPSAPKYSEQLIVATYTITTLSGSSTTFTIHTTLDTGGDAGPTIYEGTQLQLPSNFIDSSGNLVNGATFSMDVTGTNGLQYDILNLTEGSVVNGQDVTISVGNATGIGSVNTGLSVFYQNDVMFDAQDGLVGFLPVPEPSTYALLGFGLLALGSVVVRELCRRKAD